MAVAILLGSFFLFLLIGVPIAFSLGLSSLTYIFFFLPRVPLSTVAQQVFGGISSFSNTAIPFFILVGAIMESGGISKRLVTFIKNAVGHKKGGIGMIALFSSCIFASLSGSAIANVAATGCMTIPLMKKNKYPAGLAGAIEASSSSLGAVIPPSIPFVVYGGLTSISIGHLFIGGYVPGFILAFALFVMLYFQAKRLDVPVCEKVPAKEVWKSFLGAVPALLTPIIIMGGILLGIMTPTEAGAVGCVYALIISFFVYREMQLSDIPKVLLETARTTGFVMLVMAIASLFGWVMAFENIPMKIASGLVSVLKTRTMFMIGIIVLFIIVGTFIDTLSAIIILGPVLIPAATMMGIDPLHFGLIMCMGLTFGVLTPPVGTCLFVAAGIAKTTVEDVAKHALPFTIVIFVLVFVFAMVPNLLLWLPRLLGYGS